MTSQGTGPAPGNKGPGNSKGSGHTGPRNAGPGEEPSGEYGPRLHDVNEQWEVVGDPTYAPGVFVTLRTD